MEAGAKKFPQGGLWRRTTVLIFAVTGTNKRPFNRLVKAVDRIAGKKEYHFLVQRGYSTYVPKHCGYFDFCNNDMFVSYIQGAEIVICQPGFGSVGYCISHNKPMILVPREHDYGEAVDKQYELAEYLAVQNDSIVCLRDMKQLPEAIEKLKCTFPKYDYHTKIPVLIEDFMLRNFLS